ncbi:hypothetical protein [Microbacterium azadirachtae]|uniref:Uncharacterized protein n=1 Tax=Microbacterium azadirachtae TaxID=582680 RepID=A0A0F0LK49_9MICO|nr:hypothetical protein [Microbacterium azadirachtae]KJL31906.1 hypothetical protein RS86_03187 [Microbacterium azadirachtae]
MTLREDLETVIASDPVMAEDRMAAIVSLARAVADQMDAQLPTGSFDSRLLATFQGQLAQINRTIRDDRDRRLRAGAKPTASASRLAVLKAQKTAKTAGARP